VATAGLQHAEYGKPDAATGDAHVERLVLKQPGSVDAAQFDQVARDITAFLEYAGEPAALKRQSMGVWVILFLAAFTFLAWLLKKEVLGDVTGRCRTHTRPWREKALNRGHCVGDG
jgi:ubiquinol-cytochrome c reductase cytochrome c1 subunit